MLLQTSLSQTWPDYQRRYNFLPAAASTYMDGLVGFVQPANLNLIHRFEARYYWSANVEQASFSREWGLFTGIKGLGFGLYDRKMPDGNRSREYRISSGVGTPELSLGAGYGWSSGELLSDGYDRLLTTGLIGRPSRYFSIGLLGNWSLKNTSKEGVLDIGIRPLGNNRLTLFGDAALQKPQTISDASWSTGAIVTLLEGVALNARYFNGGAFTAGIMLSLGKSGVSGQLHYNNDSKRQFNNYMVRVGAQQPSFLPPLLEKDRRYFRKSLTGTVTYHKYVLFDDASHPLLQILQDIRAAAEDPRVSVIALSLSSTRMYPENAWEIRETLQKARKEGKKVVIFIDKAGMTTYHLASVANKIMLDPQGYLQLPGYLLGNTYFKGTLEKLGLGFDAWRFYKYKSAVEILSRKDMSEAEREQSQAYINDWYDLTQSDVSESRGFSRDKFNTLIDTMVFFTAEQALQYGLVDTLARWSAVNKIVEKMNRRKSWKINSDDLFANSLPTPYWGPKAKIAVIYAIGICAMDEGIRAHWLEKVFHKVSKDRSIKAVVFRVDSPGGDGMASDVVAQALKQCKQKKPVIVSQGQVAGSGGYWLSMYGTRILAAPNTITGSIGVIGGWIYNRGLTEKLGLTSDYVKRGAHADLGFGVGFAGLRLPARDLTSEEHKRVEEIFMIYYDDFVNRVARSRDMPVSRVESIAQGRYYSGWAGVQNGLVDSIGNLTDAIEKARIQAGLRPDEEIEIVQYPEYNGLINPEGLFRKAETPLDEASVYQYLKMFSRQPMTPLPMLLPGSYPQEQQ
jgi:protease-4